MPIATCVLQDTSDAVEAILSFLTLRDVGRVACVCRMWFCASKQWMRRVQDAEAWAVRWRYDDVQETVVELMGLLSIRSEVYLSDAERAIIVRALDAALCAIPESRVREWKLLNHCPAGIERRWASLPCEVFNHTLSLPPHVRAPVIRSHQYVRHPTLPQLFLVPKGDEEARRRVGICLPLIAEGVFRWLTFSFHFPSMLYKHPKTLSAIHSMTRLSRLLGCPRITTSHVASMLRFFSSPDRILSSPHAVIAMTAFFRSVGRRIIGPTFATRLGELVCVLTRRFRINFMWWTRFDQCELLASLLRLLAEQRPEHILADTVHKVRRALQRYVHDDARDLHRSTMMLFAILDRIHVRASGGAEGLHSA